MKSWLVTAYDAAGTKSEFTCDAKDAKAAMAAAKQSGLSKIRSVSEMGDAVDDEVATEGEVTHEDETEGGDPE